MIQIRERFSDPTDLKKALELLGQLDERGYLASPCADSPILSVLQSLDPPGIFARDLKECLLLQLPPHSLAYKIVDLCFHDLLHSRFKSIEKKMKITDLSSAIQSLAKLHFRPADLFQHECNPPIIADLSICQIGKTWIVESKDEELPKFHLREDYLALSPQSADEKIALRKWIASGKGLLRSLKRRRSILLEIGVFLVRKQAAYLSGRGPLQPLSMKELAEEVHLHESTLSRALADKYASTPRGILPLRSLVSSPAESAKSALQKLIEKEDRKSPLTDAELVAQLQTAGTKLSRRTVAKYRAELKIAPVSCRRYSGLGPKAPKKSEPKSFSEKG
jgi:RNA polymerase sigma-54 factor